MGSNDVVMMRAYSSGKITGGLKITLASPPKYELLWCTHETEFVTELPTETVKIWTLSMKRTSGEAVRHVLLYCNDVEVLNVLVTSSLCTAKSKSWHNDWVDEDTVRIYFFNGDNASFRPGK